VTNLPEIARPAKVVTSRKPVPGRDLLLDSAPPSNLMWQAFREAVVRFKGPGKPYGPRARTGSAGYFEAAK
jgi:hypothetical protein